MIAVRRKGEPTEEKTTIGCKETLQTKGEKGIAEIGVSELYARHVANMRELEGKTGDHGGQEKGDSDRRGSESECS